MYLNSPSLSNRLKRIERTFTFTVRSFSRNFISELTTTFIRNWYRLSLSYKMYTFLHHDVFYNFFSFTIIAYLTFFFRVAVKFLLLYASQTTVQFSQQITRQRSHSLLWEFLQPQSNKTYLKVPYF